MQCYADNNECVRLHTPPWIHVPFDFNMIQVISYGGWGFYLVLVLSVSIDATSLE